MPPVLWGWVTQGTAKKHVDMNAAGVTVVQCMDMTFVSSFRPMSCIPIQEKSCLEARKPKLVLCLTKCRENNLLYETAGGFSAQTRTLSLLCLST